MLVVDTVRPPVGSDSRSITCLRGSLSRPAPGRSCRESGRSPAATLDLVECDVTPLILPSVNTSTPYGPDATPGFRRRAECSRRARWCPTPPVRRPPCSARRVRRPRREREHASLKPRSVDPMPGRHRVEESGHRPLHRRHRRPHARLIVDRHDQLQRRILGVEVRERLRRAVLATWNAERGNPLTYRPGRLSPCRHLHDVHVDRFGEGDDRRCARSARCARPPRGSRPDAPDAWRARARIPLALERRLRAVHT